MKYKRLGKAGVKVSELCLGTMIYGQQVEEAPAIKIIRRAVDLGINFLDTADTYVNGRSEQIVGKAIEGQRDDIVLATKVYNRMGPGPNDEGLSRKHIMHAVEASLTRLGTDYIDLYQVHRFDATTPLAETLSALTDLVDMGKVHYIGCSNFAAWQIEKALRISDVHGFVALSSSQPRYNLLGREVERDLLPLCLEEGIGVIPYSPLAGGFLTGKYQPDAPMPEGSRGQLRPEWMEQYHTDQNHRVLRELQSLSEETGLKLSQLSLAWLLANPAVTAPIIGASRIQQLEENVDVVDHALTPNALQRMNDVSKPDWLQQQEAQQARMQSFQQQRIQYWRERRAA
jgi:aryl-alcohol dehydrogenase-like predicted oxidoreductase